MKLPKLLIASFGLGVVVFIAGLIAILLNYLSTTQLNAGNFLIAGALLMFGSKLVARGLLKRSRH